MPGTPAAPVPGRGAAAPLRGGTPAPGTPPKNEKGAAPPPDARVEARDGHRTADAAWLLIDDVLGGSQPGRLRARRPNDEQEARRLDDAPVGQPAAMDGLYDARRRLG